ncbi:unnamed protein product [Agarophyton chilense]
MSTLENVVMDIRRELCNVASNLHDACATSENVKHSPEHPAEHPNEALHNRETISTGNGLPPQAEDTPRNSKAMREEIKALPEGNRNDEALNIPANKPNPAGEAGHKICTQLAADNGPILRELGPNMRDRKAQARTPLCTAELAPTPQEALEKQPILLYFAGIRRGPIRPYCKALSSHVVAGRTIGILFLSRGVGEFIKSKKLPTEWWWQRESLATNITPTSTPS